MYYNLIYMKVFSNLFDVVYIIYKELCIKNYYKAPTTDNNININITTTTNNNTNNNNNVTNMCSKWGERWRSG
jgi:hypothetical protein